MSTINEQSALFFRAAFRDADGEAATPSAITYRIDCLTTGAAVLAWTGVTPASSVEVRIGATLNAILDRDNARESRRITLVTAYGGDVEDQLVTTHDYDLRRVDHI